jgi:hypothetical protein
VVGALKITRSKVIVLEKVISIAFEKVSVLCSIDSQYVSKFSSKAFDNG